MRNSSGFVARHWRWVALASLLLAAIGCNSGEESAAAAAMPDSCSIRLSPGADDQTTVQTALIQAAEGSTVCFEAGTFSFNTELSLEVKGVTLIGAGQDQTILDFSMQDTGGNGLLVRSDEVTLQDFQMRNTPGDGIRVDSVNGIRFFQIAVVWDVAASDQNGAYGLYPVNSTNVTIDTCLVKGARDAGIYVGQSNQILVVNNEAYGNVAGIEIENSTDAIVSNNHAHDNTGGILVFNLPGLPVGDGKRANVFDNLIENNNQANFGVAGTTVANVPAGLGILILASDDNEIHNNDIKGNKSSAVVVISYLEALFGMYNDPEFDPFPQGNFIHDNQYSDNGTSPVPAIALQTPIVPVPDILWDGCTDAMAMDDGHLTNCISEPTATYLNFNYCNELPADSQDVAPVTCTYEPLPKE